MGDQTDGTSDRRGSRGRHRSGLDGSRASLLALVFALGSCSDDGGGPFAVVADDGSTTSPPADSGGVPVTSDVGGDGESPGGDGEGGVNGPLSGSLVAMNDRTRTLLSLDLESGRVRTLPGTRSTIAANELDRSGVRIALEPDRSNEGGMVATISGCSREDPEIVCIAALNGEGDTVSTFAFESVADSGLVSPAKRSRDGRFVALRDRGEGASSDIDLYTMEGRYVSGLGIGTTSAAARPYDWLPSGELLVARPSNTSPVTLVRTEPYTTRPSRDITLPSSFEGEVDEIIVSPSGEKVVVKLDESPDEAREVLIVDLATLDVTLPFSIRPGEPRGEISALTWSPDSRWLYLSRSFGTGQAPTGTTGTRTHYAVPVDGRRHVLSTREQDAVEGWRIVLAEDEDARDGRLRPGEVMSDVSVWLD